MRIQMVQATLTAERRAVYHSETFCMESNFNFQVAISANGTTILWSSGNAGPLVSSNNSSFTSVSSIPSGAIIASDKRNSSVFYAASSSKFYLSTNAAQSFTVVGSLGTSTSPVKIVVNPNLTGDVWVSTDKGLFHSGDSGSTLTAVSGVTQVTAS